MKILSFKIGGIHPPQEKTAPADKIIDAGLPTSVRIPLRQHIGAEATPIVKPGQCVARGEKIAEAAGKISAPVHASISGTVKSIGPVRIAQGKYINAITIAASDEQHQADCEAKAAAASPIDYSALSPKEIDDKIADSGIVGLGGATFPTAVKLTPPPGTKAEMLIINACECEPCLTCDDALMRSHPCEIIEGIKIMMRAAGTPKAIIGIESNKPEAYKALKACIADNDSIELQLLKPRYPQGCEKQLIYALTGREMPSGSLPISVGAIVQNVATAYAAYQAIALGQPLIERVVTIAGCGNYLAPIGMTIADLPATALHTAREADVVAGGPMMGQSTVTLDAPVVKGLSGISVFSPLPFAPEPCIRCGECAKACPMGLEPYAIATYGRLSRCDDAKSAGAMDCIECGSCSYSCPSARPVLDFIKLAKRQIRQQPK